MKNRFILKLLFVVLAIEILGEILFVLNGIPHLVYFFKPLLMPLLILWYLKSVEKPLKIIIYALVFSFFGDVFLMFLMSFPDKEYFFLAGLASFLVAHVLYIVLFVKYINKAKKSILTRKPYLVFPFVLYGISLLMYLYSAANSKFIEMQIPVIVYAAVIMFMVIAAIARYERVLQKSFAWVLVGALLFMFSDTLIALNNFSEIFTNKKYIAKFFIMSLYVIGQYLITAGIVEWQNNSKD